MMARALALSDVAEPLGVQSSSVNPSVSNAETITAGTFRKSAEKLTHPKLNLAEARAVLRKHAKAVIVAAFPERSQYQTCLKAAAVCGVSPDKIERLINGEPVNPDVLVLAFCARICRDRTGKPTPICNVLGQIMAVEMFA